MARKAKPKPRTDPLAPFKARKAVPMARNPGATQDEGAKDIARQIAAPELNGYRMIATAEGQTSLGEWIDTPGMLSELRRIGAEVNAGDLSRAESMLITQAVALECLSVRLLERGWAETGLSQFETFMRLSLKALSQSRLAIEALATLKQGPAVFAKQANLSQGGPLQVNNHAPPPAPPCARENENPPTQLLEQAHELDPRETRATSAGDSEVEALGTLNRPKDN